MQGLHNERGARHTISDDHAQGLKGPREPRQTRPSARPGQRGRQPSRGKKGPRRAPAPRAGAGAEPPVDFRVTPRPVPPVQPRPEATRSVAASQPHRPHGLNPLGS
ncbi:hypothetical protein P7K49_025714 [Saguinus oedipus]|uniref:Uncharacterized protein n=1 Tax=Saguinus oedipus TaxID=9490 RepID=A0ABQ9UHZ1_SAGOE|nr:hypothetical protein P7K49_025714 [Saguinus oedipus]